MLAIVPARGGSKRLPDKNIRKLAGRPLLFHSLDAFLGHSEVETVVFTTDSSDYAEAVEEAYSGRVDIAMRPSEFAADNTKVVYEVERLLRLYGVPQTDFFMVGLPTAPLRNAGHVRRMLDDFAADGAGRFSCCEYGFPVQFAFSIDVNNEWTPYAEDSPMVTGNTRSQDLQAYFRPTGAIYLQNVATFLDSLSFYKGAKVFLMDRKSSTDVDTLDDFKLAESLMRIQNV